MKVRRLFKGNRACTKGEVCLIQLPNKFGLVSILRQLKRRFREAESKTFEMRYWSRNSIRKGLNKAGLVDFAIYTDGFFSQNPQLSETFCHRQEN